MTDIIREEYNSSGQSVDEFFRRTEEGYFVPPYQRKYTWEEDNINQLFDDLISGTRDLSRSENATTFLGTAILTTLENKIQSVKNGEERAQPTAVQVVIDGQQRISTLALISIQIITKIGELLKGVPEIAPYEDLHHASKRFVKRLKRLYAVNLGEGADPELKPKIIRAEDDRWTYVGGDDAYTSPIARYIATYIREGNVEKAFSAIDEKTGARVRGNLTLINKWLDDVSKAHNDGAELFDQFPIRESITTDRIRRYILNTTDDGLKDILEKIDKTEVEDYATATYQILLLAYYLLNHCGVNLLQPTYEEWGFDMFQALNATGTPLTAIETFLPQVMQAETTANCCWRESPSCESMDEIQKLFESATTNEQKGQRTNELLGAFALCYEGKKLGNKFSDQRKWMTRTYNQELLTISEKREYVGKLAQIANFYYVAWHMEDTVASNCISGLEEHPEGKLASMLVRYLRDANSKLSAPILARFYSQALNQDASFDEFVEAAKACAAFFTLWRSAKSTSGLDNIYRRYFMGSDRGVPVNGHSWMKLPEPVSAGDLKKYFLEMLQEKGIANFDAWVTGSEHFLHYEELKTICRFVLFLSGHDRIVSDARPGLTNPGTPGTCPLLELSYWKAQAYKSLEHVAPQNPPTSHNWDPKIYEDDLVHQIGNLILLPTDLNRIAENKDWVIKYLYYCHAGERDETKLNNLSAAASGKGIQLRKRTVDVLKKAEYNCAVEPIISIKEDGSWDASLIRMRTRQNKQIAWEKLSLWLQS